MKVQTSITQRKMIVKNILKNHFTAKNVYFPMAQL